MEKKKKKITTNPKQNETKLKYLNFVQKDKNGTIAAAACTPYRMNMNKCEQINVFNIKFCVSSSLFCFVWFCSGY